MKKSTIPLILATLAVSLCLKNATLHAQTPGQPRPAPGAPQPQGDLPSAPPPGAPPEGRAPYPRTTPFYQFTPYSFGNNFGLPGKPGRSHATASVVRFSAAAQGTREALEEDLTVMAVLLQRNIERGFGQSPSGYRMGIPMLVTSHAPQATYTEGFGALFQLQVNFPLTATSGAEPKRAPSEPESEWEAARNEVRGVPPPPAIDDETPRRGAPAYDPDQVTGLKKQILQTLKQAGNIRHVGASEFIAVSVRGPGTSAAGPPRGDWPSLPMQGPGTKGPPPFSPAGGGGGGGGFGGQAPESWGIFKGQVSEPGQGGGATFLAIRVKKTDVDSYSKGTLTDDEFAAKALINAEFKMQNAERRF